MGKPSRAGDDRLVYTERTRDPVNGKVDLVTVVRFKGGKAIAVDY